MKGEIEMSKQHIILLLLFPQKKAVQYEWSRGYMRKENKKKNMFLNY